MGKKKNNNKKPIKKTNNQPKQKNNNKKQKINSEEKKLVNAKRVVKEINNIIAKAVSTPKPIVPKKWKEKEVEKIEVKEIKEEPIVEEEITEKEVKDEVKEELEEKKEEEKEETIIDKLEEYKDTIFDDKSLVSKIIIVLVLVILSLILVIYNQSIDNKESKDDTPVATKHDKSKDYVFNATYKNTAKAHEVVINNNTYYSDNLIVPYINFRTADADLVNGKIKSIYDDAINIFNMGYKDKKTYVEELKYNYYVNSNVVSVVITYKYFLDNDWNTKYYVYNFNVNSGSKISNASLLKEGHMNKELFYNSLNTSLINHLNDINAENQDNEKLKNMSIKKYKQQKHKKVFMASNQTINVIVPVYYNTQNYVNTIIEL